MQLYLSFSFIESQSSNSSQNHVGAGFKHYHCLKDYMHNLFRIRDQINKTAIVLWSSKCGILSTQ